MSQPEFSYNHSNGNLRIAIMKNPCGEWDVNKGDRHLSFDFDGKDYIELFRVLRLPLTPTKRSEGEDYDQYNNRLKRRFQETLTNKGYEMLGHIWDMYDDAIYLPSEINQLLEECLKLKGITQNEDALIALEKLIFSCNEAIKTESGLCLLSD